MQAHDELEKYRDEYDRLCSKPEKLFARATELFKEPLFSELRFSISDLKRAFANVGYPLIDFSLEQMMPLGVKVVDVLLDDQKRTRLSRLLLCRLPGLVAAQRYMDAWIVQHNAILVKEPPEGGCGVFFAGYVLVRSEGMGSRARSSTCRIAGSPWRRSGNAPAKGFAAVELLLDKLRDNPRMQADMQAFLDAYPELKAYTQAQCFDNETAALKLAGREDISGMFLPFKDVEPWINVLEQRLSEDPELSKLIMKGVKSGRKIENVMLGITYKVGVEMAGAVFSQKRINQLLDDFRQFQRSLSKPDHELQQGINGALLALRSSVRPEENNFLAILCGKSLVIHMKKLADAESTLSE